MENMPRISLFLLFSLALGCTGGAIGDTLLVQSVQAGSGVARPTSGMLMEQVVQRYGEPQQRLGPVGEPPISHWVYDGFIVYFEHQRVIHAVVPH
jgi:hypothetical protein